MSKTDQIVQSPESGTHGLDCVQNVGKHGPGCTQSPESGKWTGALMQSRTWENTEWMMHCTELGKCGWDHMWTQELGKDRWDCTGSLACGRMWSGGN